MAKYTVITMPGDGIGNQVLPESLRVLKAVGFAAEYIYADIGWDCWCTQGNALPDRVKADSELRHGGDDALHTLEIPPDGKPEFSGFFGGYMENIRRSEEHTSELQSL